MADTDRDEAAGHYVICEPRQDCADPNVNRWHCMRGHDGAEPNTCPLSVCERRGANRTEVTG